MKTKSRDGHGSVEVRKRLGEVAVEFVTKLFTKTLQGEKMPEERRKSVQVSDSCRAVARGMSHTSLKKKLWERVAGWGITLMFSSCYYHIGI